MKELIFGRKDLVLAYCHIVVKLCSLSWKMLGFSPHHLRAVGACGCKSVFFSNPKVRDLKWNRNNCRIQMQQSVHQNNPFLLLMILTTLLLCEFVSVSVLPRKSCKIIKVLCSYLHYCKNTIISLGWHMLAALLGGGGGGLGNIFKNWGCGVLLLKERTFGLRFGMHVEFETF